MEVLKGELLPALLNVGRAVKSGNDITESIKLQAKGGRAILKSTNLDLGIQQILKTEDLDELTCVIPYRIFTEIIRKLNSDKIKIQKEENSILLKSGRSKFTIQSKNVEFPTPDVEKDLLQFEIESKVLKKAILQTSFAAAIDDTRPILKGINFQYINGHLNFAALDGYRISFGCTNIETSKEFNIVIPAKELTEMAKILGNTGIVKVAIGSNFIHFFYENIVFSIRLLQGDFLNYKGFIPNDSRITVGFLTTDLRDAVERISVITNEKVISLKILKDKLELSAKSTIGHSVEEIPISNSSDSEEELKIAFNSNYLLDVLKSTGDEELSINLTNNVSPCLIKGNDNQAFIILPIRIAA